MYNKGNVIIIYTMCLRHNNVKLDITMLERWKEGRVWWLV